MKLFYHETDGGAEYYCTKCVEGTDEGEISSSIMRTDGGEIEIFYERLIKQGLKLVIR